MPPPHFAIFALRVRRRPRRDARWFFTTPCAGGAQNMPADSRRRGLLFRRCRRLMFSICFCMACQRARAAAKDFQQTRVRRQDALFSRAPAARRDAAAPPPHAA